MVPREAWIAVYMMADHYRGTLYTGVTAYFHSRIIQHREGRGGFTKRYGLTRLVWYEVHDLMTEAIQRETSLKRPTIHIGTIYTRRCSSGRQFRDRSSQTQPSVILALVARIPGSARKGVTLARRRATPLPVRRTKGFSPQGRE